MLWSGHGLKAGDVEARQVRGRRCEFLLLRGALLASENFICSSERSTWRVAGQNGLSLMSSEAEEREGLGGMVDRKTLPKDLRA